MLLGLTFVTVLVTGYMLGGAWAPALIMAAALAKYLLVAFYFMELRKAHTVWKFVAIMLGVLTTAVVTLTVTAG